VARRIIIYLILIKIDNFKSKVLDYSLTAELNMVVEIQLQGREVIRIRKLFPIGTEAIGLD
jgi:hypothetical protein